MKRKLSFTLGIIVLVMIGLATSPAKAAGPNVSGPYYTIPSWSQTLPASTRFIVLANMNGDAVLDKETGLVWEKSPSFELFSWGLAHNHCNTLAKGNRMGWRLPTLQELSSLVDPSVAPPILPAGHPFPSDISGQFWSASSSVLYPTSAWVINFSLYNPQGLLDKLNPNVPAWCVRSGQGVDPQ